MAKGLSKEELTRIIMETAAPAAASFGLEVWGIDLAGAGRPVARIFVEVPPAEMTSRPETDEPEADGDLLPPGVSVDQCAEISRMVGLALDVEEAFPEAWVLEVSSPGLDRLFFRVDQMRPYIGRDVDVVLWNPHPEISGRRKFRGELVATDGDAFTLKTETEAGVSPSEVSFQWGDVRRARLIHIFPDTSKPGQGKAPRSPKNAGAAAGKGGGKSA